MFMSNYFSIGTRDVVRAFSASLENTIVYGTLDEELEFDFADNSSYDFSFENCVVKTELNADSLGFIDCIVNPGVPTGATNPLFVSPGENDYHLIENSRAIDNGKQISVSTDLDGELRDSNPDIGAFEYIEG
jgi:hypothetical protein